MTRTTLALLLCLAIAGCGHRETAQGAVSLGVTVDAMMAAKTLDQVKAIGAWAKQLADAITKREAAGLPEPIQAKVTVQDVLDATDPALTPDQRRPAAEKVKTELGSNLKALDQAGASDAAVAGAINWVLTLIAATTGGGALLAGISKLRNIVQTGRTLAETAFEGMHQAQTALRQVDPEAARAIDADHVLAQMRAGPAVVNMGDQIVARAKSKRSKQTTSKLPTVSVQG